MAVRILDVVIDFLDQFLDAAKGSPAKSSLRDAIEPDLHLIQPGGASILVAMGIAGWVLIQRHNETVLSQTAVLDLRNRSASRSPEPNLGEPPLELRRRFSQLNIYLPLGSPEGAYEVRIVTASGDSLLNMDGTAQLNEGITTLQVRGNSFIVRPGQYILQIWKAPSEWNSYPLVLR